jgi:uncharacterized protein (DUF952 family)
MKQFKLFLMLVFGGFILQMNTAFADDGQRGKWYSDKYIVCDTNILNWPEIQKSGEYSPESLKTEKFIHCATPKQLGFIANKFFKETRIVWVIDPNLVSSPIKYEQGINGDLYPHIYGPLNLNAIIAKFEMHPKSDWTYDVPEEFLPLENYDESR